MFFFIYMMCCKFFQQCKAQIIFLGYVCLKIFCAFIFQAGFTKADAEYTKIVQPELTHNLPYFSLCHSCVTDCSCAYFSTYCTAYALHLTKCSAGFPTRRRQGIVDT